MSKTPYEKTAMVISGLSCFTHQVYASTGRAGDYLAYFVHRLDSDDLGIPEVDLTIVRRGQVDEFTILVSVKTDIEWWVHYAWNRGLPTSGASSVVRFSLIALQAKQLGKAARAVSDFVMDQKWSSDFTRVSIHFNHDALQSLSIVAHPVLKALGFAPLDKRGRLIGRRQKGGTAIGSTDTCLAASPLGQAVDGKRGG